MKHHFVHSAFEQIVERFPHHIAVQETRGSCTYKQLNEQANMIAHCMIGLKLFNAEVVGTWLDSNTTYLSSILGIMKAGGAFMPIEVEYPTNRIESIHAFAKPRFIITDSGHVEQVIALVRDNDTISGLEKLIVVDRVDGKLRIQLGNLDGELLNVETDWDRSNPEIQITGDDRSYVFFTSGSTGEPKAIEGRHKGLSHFIHWEIHEFKLKEDVRVSQFAPLTFDVSLRDIFVPLLSGGTLCIPPRDYKRQLPQLIDWLSSSRVTLVHIVPSLFRLLTEECRQNPSFVAALSSLKTVLLAGEPLWGRDVLAWWSLFGEKVELVNLYGPTETTLAKIFNRIPFGPLDAHATVALGKPLPNTHVILLKNNRLCQVNEIGEICIKTPFRSRGYLNNEELTSSKFIQNPLHNDFEDIIYVTGDLGRYLENGLIGFVGRMDSQVKIAGNRVELSEIEVVLSKHAGLKQPIVIAQGDPGGELVLVCYYLSDQALDIESIKKVLADFLPSYMHPVYYMNMSSYPVSINGKLDKKALPRAELLRKENYEEPIGETEKRLEQMWCEILKTSRVSRSTSFFDAGGSSLKAIQIISRVHKEFGVLIKLTDLFENPTIKALSNHIVVAKKEAFSVIVPQNAKAYYRLTSAQKRLWVLSHINEQNIAYNITSAYELNGHLNVDALRSAFTEVIKRHESLRTVFTIVDDEPKQKILSVEQFDFQITAEEWAGDPDDLRQIISTAGAQPFNLTKGPLLRAKIFQLTDQHWVLVFTIHHIISDGWSHKVLARDLMTFYNAFVAGVPASSTPLKIHYKDYAEWQHSVLSTVSLSDSRNYWLKQFKDEIPLLELPADHARPNLKTFNGRKVRF